MSTNYQFEKLPLFMNVKTAARFLQGKPPDEDASVGSVYNLRCAGVLPCYKPGGKTILFKTTDLIAYIESIRIPSKAEIESEAAIHSAGQK